MFLRLGRLSRLFGRRRRLCRHLWTILNWSKKLSTCPGWKTPFFNAEDDRRRPFTAPKFASIRPLSMILWQIAKGMSKNRDENSKVLWAFKARSAHPRQASVPSKPFAIFGLGAKLSTLRFPLWKPHSTAPQKPSIHRSSKPQTNPSDDQTDNDFKNKLLILTSVFLRAPFAAKSPSFPTHFLCFS